MRLVFGTILVLLGVLATEAIKIGADAAATYNQKVASSLTTTLIQQRYLEKWDGKLPQFSMGSGGSAPGVMLNVPMPAPAKP